MSILRNIFSGSFLSVAQHIDNDKYELYYSGIFFSKNNVSIDIFCETMLSDCADFDSVSGFFKAALRSKEDNSWFLFGDNSGSQYFYVDTETGIFSDSFLFLKNQRKGCYSVDYDAVSQILVESRMLGNLTPITEIKRVAPDDYCIIRRGTIEMHSKNLSDFSSEKLNEDLDALLRDTLKACNGRRFCAVCTGGTDSRTILAGLLKNGVRPDLILTGYEYNPDVKIAREIAKATGLSLTVLTPEEKEIGWLEKAFAFSDGMTDAVLAHRHLKKALWAKENGFEYEFGGVGGEYYKNYFWNGLTHLMKAYLFKLPYCSISINDLRQKKFTGLIEEMHLRRKELKTVNKCGYDYHRPLCGSLTNAYSSYCCKVDPLMDRRLVASVSCISPKKLRNARWQRQQIADFAPALSEIATDQGLTCSNRYFRILAEEIKTILRRLFRKLTRIFHIKGKNVYWNQDYIDARKEPIWRKCIETCANLEILKEGITEDEIPLGKTGIIILLGMLFEDIIPKTE